MLTKAHAPLTRQRLEELLAAARTLRVGVVGDAGLDVYWDADMTLSRLSRENPHHILPVLAERMFPGGGSHLAVCVAAAGVRAAPYLAVIGDDWRGRELPRLLPEYGVPTDYLVMSDAWVTTAYCKPLRRGLTDLVYEDPHLYFENHSPLPARAEQQVLARLEAMLHEVDALVVTDYLEYGVVTAPVRERLAAAGREGLLMLVDSRDRIRHFRNAVLKPNDLEALWAFSPQASPQEATLPRLEEAGRRLARENAARVCITLGEQGCLWVEGEASTLVPTRPAPPPTDIVGAGDAFAAACAVALAAGASGPEAAAMANLAAGVVVRKLRMTGSASPEEILQRFDEDCAA